MSRKLDDIENLIHRGATDGERQAARDAYRRVAGHDYEQVEQARGQRVSHAKSYQQASTANQTYNRYQKEQDQEEQRQHQQSNRERLRREEWEKEAAVRAARTNRAAEQERDIREGPFDGHIDNSPNIQADKFTHFGGEANYWETVHYDSFASNEEGLQ